VIKLKVKPANTELGMSVKSETQKINTTKNEENFIF
jgi:hypothetical protein